MKILKKEKKFSVHKCQRNSEWGGATSSWRDQERVFQELKDVLNSYGKWLVGIILKFPGLNHFQFLPPNRVTKGEDTCSVWSDDAPLQERAPWSSLQQKAVRRSNVDPENNSVFLFLFLFLILEPILSPCEEKQIGIIKMGLWRGNLT